MHPTISEIEARNKKENYNFRRRNHNYKLAKSYNLKSNQIKKVLNDDSMDQISDSSAENLKISSNKKDNDKFKMNRYKSSISSNNNNEEVTELTQEAYNKMLMGDQSYGV